MIYGRSPVGLPRPALLKNAKKEAWNDQFNRALQEIAGRTGGVAFLPRTAEEVDEISSTVAHDIRNQYNIVYKPSSPKEGYHSLKVVARASGYKDLQVRTKSGYFSGQQQAAK